MCISYMYLYTPGYLFSVLFLQQKNREEDETHQHTFLPDNFSSFPIQATFKTVETFFRNFSFLSFLSLCREHRIKVMNNQPEDIYYKLTNLWLTLPPPSGIIPSFLRTTTGRHFFSFLTVKFDPFFLI